MWQKQFKKHKIKLGIVLFLGLIWFFCLPTELFKTPTSTVITSANGTLIGARIADDGQWRFPEPDTIPYRFKESILLFEDEYFYRHPGFNPISIFNAIKHNITKDTRRGGSTITQQVIRLSRQHKNRTYFEKLVELIMATRLEFKLSKNDILKQYATHTPYGGNVVGLETASWRYFGINANELSWGQAATLAVLPNAPALIFPGKNEAVLLKKRNRLLKKLFEKKKIDQTTYELALLEPLPSKPLRLPNITPHLTERIRKEHPGERIHTSIDFNLQQQVNAIAAEHYQRLQSNEINNLAILVLDVETRNVLAYVGNSTSEKKDASYVDIISKNRSTGSTLKPLLFASLLSEGQLLPSTLIKDVPTVINGYNPKNFTKTHVGAVPANRALSRSLNVPAVRSLMEYGLQKFYNKLKKLNFKALDKPAGHYGLALILGGAESSLWEITQTYAGMAATLNHFNDNMSVYRTKEYVQPNYLKNAKIDFGATVFETDRLNAGAIYHTFKAMREVNRPEGDENWHFFDSSQPLAWKTGTSFGFKDAWAVGVTPKYAIGVWAGNADGEGRPGLTGITAAAPILFNVLDRLPHSGWFTEPLDDLIALQICKESGHIASPFCTNPVKTLVPVNGKKSEPCFYHKSLALDSSGNYQVNASCYPLENIQTKSWFVLPTLMEYYYSNAYTDYSVPPPFLEGCSVTEKDIMEFIYPKKNEIVLLPKDLGEKKQELILKLAHQTQESKVYWYLDDTFIGETQDFHELILPIETGVYQLIAVDDKGNKTQQKLEVKMASGN